MTTRASSPAPLPRRQFLRLLGLGSGVALLAACAPSPSAAPTTAPAGASPAPAGQAGATSAPAQAASGQKVTLSMLAGADPLLLKGYQAVLDGFRQSEGGKWANVDITFDTAPTAQLYPKIETSVAAGATWDLLQADGPQIKHYAYNKAIRPLQEFFLADEIKQWAEPSIIEGTYKGTFYAPPMMQSATMLFYNSELTDKHQIKPPQELDKAWNLDQAIEAWQKATERSSPDAQPDVWGIWPAQGEVRSDYVAGVFRRGAGAKDSNAFKGLAPDGITASGYFDAPEAIKGMQVYQDLSQKLKISPVQPIPNIFFSKKAAFQLSPDNTIGTINQQFPAGEFKWGVSPYPFFQGGTPMTHTGSWHWAIAPNTKQLDTAVAFVRFASGKAGSKLFYDVVQQIPARLDLLKELPEYQSYPKKLFLDGLLNIGVPRVQTPGYQEFQTVVLETNNSIAQGANVEQIMHEAAKKMDQALAKYKGWDQ